MQIDAEIENLLFPSFETMVLEEKALKKTNLKRHIFILFKVDSRLKSIFGKMK
jgi:hypothetical protein